MYGAILICGMICTKNPSNIATYLVKIYPIYKYLRRKTEH